MMHAEYFDEDGKLVNAMHCSDIKMLGGKLLPGRMEMVPAEKKGNKIKDAGDKKVFFEVYKKYLEK